MAIKPGWTGRVFEDFTVGDVYEHPLGRTLLAADNVWFSCLTMNTNPIHFDAEYASRTEFGRPLMNSCFTLALVTGQSVTDLTQNAVANLGWDDVRLPHPVFEGDTIYARSEVLETRESKSRPNVGIVRVKTTGLNQRATPVIEFTRTFMVWKRGHVPDARRRTPDTPDTPA
jgi:itaconyl-CoA hydratase